MGTPTECQSGGPFMVAAPTNLAVSTVRRCLSTMLIMICLLKGDPLEMKTTLLQVSGRSWLD